MHFLHNTQYKYRPTRVYDLDVIISVGYRVKSEERVKLSSFSAVNVGGKGEGRRRSEVWQSKNSNGTMVQWYIGTLQQAENVLNVTLSRCHHFCRSGTTMNGSEIRVLHCRHLS
jgi:hypothetical protein